MEVKTVVFDMAPLKAPRVDGLHATFYQENQAVVGSSVCDFVRRIMDENKFKGWINKTLLIFIQEKEKPKSIQQFQPINLYTVLYKIVSNVLWIN